jgi:hypothetical protein
MTTPIALRCADVSFSGNTLDICEECRSLGWNVHSCGTFNASIYSTVKNSCFGIVWLTNRLTGTDPGSGEGALHIRIDNFKDFVQLKKIHGQFQRFLAIMEAPFASLLDPRLPPSFRRKGPLILWVILLRPSLLV